MKKKEKKRIKVGDIFFIDLLGLKTWFYNEEAYFFCASGNVVDFEESILAVAKYLGNGIIEEMTTGEKILIDKFGSDSIPVEQDNDFEYFAYADYFTEKIEATPDITPSRYLEKLERIKTSAFEHPLTFSFSNYYVHDFDDDLKGEYLEISDAIRKRKIKFLKKEALIKSKDFIMIVDDYIRNFDVRDELIGDEEVDKANFENKLLEFKRKI